MTNFRGSRIRFEQLGVVAKPAPNMDTLDNFMARNNHTAVNYLKVGPKIDLDTIVSIICLDVRDYINS
jgi:hypothetical protein